MCLRRQGLGAARGGRRAALEREQQGDLESSVCDVNTCDLEEAHLSEDVNEIN